MKTIKAKPITTENFSYYGQFTDLLNPTGFSLGDFYHDRVKMNVAGNYPITFSPLTVHKADPMIVTQVEYHNTTQEGILCLDDDFVLHVAPPSKEPVPEQPVLRLPVLPELPWLPALRPPVLPELP